MLHDGEQRIVEPKPPAIFVYRVIDQDLDRIKSAGGRAARGSALASFCGSVAASCGIALGSGSVEQGLRDAVIVVAAICVVITVFAAVTWVQGRHEVTEIVDRIREPGLQEPELEDYYGDFHDF